MAAVITPEHPASPEATALIAELDAHLTPLYPSESRHGFSVQKLIADAVAFFVIRDNGAPAGCGGIKLFGTEYGEIKRMWVRPKFRGLGLREVDARPPRRLREGSRRPQTTSGDRHPSARRHPVIRAGGLQAYSAVWAIPGRPGQPVLRKTHSVKAAT
jgi:hypothetical protein